jgi:hypothetical protein
MGSAAVSRVDNTAMKVRMPSATIISETGQATPGDNCGGDERGQPAADRRSELEAE